MVNANWVPTMYMEKPEIRVGKSSGSRHSVGTIKHGSENNLWAVICGNAFFLFLYSF